jgi:G3E family GTPase
MQLEETSSQSHSKREASESGGGGGGEEAAQQIAYADRILLNKTDLLLSNTDGTSASQSRKTTHTLECVLEEIRSINPTAPVHATTFSKVPDLAWILDAKCFDAERVKDIDDTFALGDIGNDEDDNSDHICTDAHCSDAGHDHSHFHRQQHEHRHTSSVSTTALIQTGSVNLRRVHTWLASLLWPDQDEDDAVLTARLQQLMQQDEQEAGAALGSTTGTGNDMANNEMRIFRIKGILSVQHPCDESSVPLDGEEVDNTNGNNVGSNWLDHRRYIVQGVNDLWEIHPGSDSLRYTDGEERICKLIFIGRCLDRAKLLAGFEKCFC